MNEMAGLCALTGVDIEGRAPRHGQRQAHRHPFHLRRLRLRRLVLPKDVRALIRSAEQQGYDSQILRAVEARNAAEGAALRDPRRAVPGTLAGRTVALWGLAFKPGTDDLREAPSLVLLEALLPHGVRVRAHDPVANAGGRGTLSGSCGLRPIDAPRLALRRRRGRSMPWCW